MESPVLDFLPYGRQGIDQDDIDRVVQVLKSDWLTQGPMVDAFESSLAEMLTAKSAVACCNGTAALHLSMLALGLGETFIVWHGISLLLFVMLALATRRPEPEEAEEPSGSAR